MNVPVSYEYDREVFPEPGPPIIRQLAETTFWLWKRNLFIFGFLNSERVALVYYLNYQYSD